MRFTVERPLSAVVHNDVLQSRSVDVDMGNSLSSCSGKLTSIGPPPSAVEQRNLLDVGDHADADDDDGQVHGAKTREGEGAECGDETVRDLRVLETLVDRGRRFAERQTRRIVHKDGTYNIARQNVTERRRRYLVDIFTTLVDMRWRYNVVLFGAAFIVSWTAFAVVWFGIAQSHGDCHHRDDDDWKPCVSNVYDFSTALLFSIETQTTIGYGSVYTISFTGCRTLLDR